MNTSAASQLTAQEQRIANKVATQFKAAVATEQAWLADFVEDLTIALCEAYGAAPLRAALQRRMDLVTDATPLQSTRRTLVQKALATAAARSGPTSP
jgi:acyl-homoserine lactone acylase PvdQ